WTRTAKSIVISRLYARCFRRSRRRRGPRPNCPSVCSWLSRNAGIVWYAAMTHGSHRHRRDSCSDRLEGADRGRGSRREGRARAARVRGALAGKDRGSGAGPLRDGTHLRRAARRPEERRHLLPERVFAEPEVPAKPRGRAPALLERGTAREGARAAPARRGALERADAA